MSSQIISAIGSTSHSAGSIDVSRGQDYIFGCMISAAPGWEDGAAGDPIPFERRSSGGCVAFRSF